MKKIHVSKKNIWLRFHEECVDSVDLLLQKTNILYKKTQLNCFKVEELMKFQANY